MSKLSKLINSPGEFLRDFFLKYYPQTFGGYRITTKDRYYAEYIDSKLLISNNIEEEIDVVYTWVNNDDNKWKLKKDFYINKFKNCNKLFPESINEQRFENHGELYYSIKGLKRFAPWIRKIFIVTDGQIPKLNSLDKIIIIDHKEIIEDEYLPTFNSHVIEANLHKIPGLSENFIYFNDDVFLAKKIKKQHFFRRNGLASLFLSDRYISMQLKNGIITPTLQASLNSLKIINKNFGINFIDRPLIHTYIPLNKQVFNYCYNLCYENIKKFSINKFRSKEDLNMATFFVPWVMYLKGRAFENIDICYYLNINSKSFCNDVENLNKIIGTKYAPHSFCLNDVNTNNKNLDKNKIYIRDLFDKI